jgi:hypothetical protein
MQNAKPKHKIRNGAPVIRIFVIPLFVIHFTSLDIALKVSPPEYRRSSNKIAS